MTEPDVSFTPDPPDPRLDVLDDEIADLIAEARIIRHEEDKTWLEITLREGRNQQIRRMGDATGFRVMRLARTSFAGVTSEGLRPGEWRPLSRDELVAIREEFGVPRRIASAAKRAAQAVPRPTQKRGPAPRPEAPARSARTDRSGRTPRGAGPRGPRARGRVDR